MGVKMDEDLALVTPELDGIPEDDASEPEDATVYHNATVADVEDAT